MATCRFPRCRAADGSSALPPGWALVQLDRRVADRDGALAFDRRRFLLCPDHAGAIYALGPLPFAAEADPDSGSDAIGDRAPSQPR